MRLKLNGRAELQVEREPNDPRLYSESLFWYALKRELTAHGNDAIKKLMWKDGHLVSDTQHYVRDRKGKWLLHDEMYAIRNLAHAYNRGPVYLAVYGDGAPCL